MGVYIFFLIGGHVTTIPILCGISSALLHYFLLVFFGWTAVEAVWLYIKLVKVLGMHSVTSNYALKASLPTWSKEEINSAVLAMYSYLIKLPSICSDSSAHCGGMCSCWFKVLHQSFLVSAYPDTFNRNITYQFLMHTAVEQRSGHFGSE